MTRQAEESQQEDNQQSQTDDEEDDDTNVKAKPKLGWFAWIIDGGKNILYSIFSIIRMPYDLLFGK